MGERAFKKLSVCFDKTVGGRRRVLILLAHKSQFVLNPESIWT